MKKVKLHTLAKIAANYKFHAKVSSGNHGGFNIDGTDLPVEMFHLLGKEHNYKTLLGDVQIASVDHTWFIPEEIIESRSMDMEEGDIVLFHSFEELEGLGLVHVAGNDVRLASKLGSYHVTKGPCTKTHFHIEGNLHDWPYEIIKSVVKKGTIGYSCIISTIS